MNHAPNSLESLKILYPNAQVKQISHTLDASSFAKQKAKSSVSQGGAIGVVWVSDEDTVLVKRSDLHAGWAIPGGSVELGESFEHAFVREVAEETGLHISSVRLLEIEDKTFISPSQEIVLVPIAVFVGDARGQTPVVTEEAQKEGLEIAVFDINNLPEVMIMQDREKVLKSVDVQ